MVIFLLEIWYVAFHVWQSLLLQKVLLKQIRVLTNFYRFPLEKYNCNNIFILLWKYILFSPFLLKIRKKKRFRMLALKDSSVKYFSTRLKYTVETPLKNMKDIACVWSIYIALLLHDYLHLHNPFIHVLFIHLRPGNIFIPAPMISSGPFFFYLFFFNLKHRVNHELSFRVVSEERYASRARNSPARVFTVRLSAPETVAALDLTSPVLSFEKIGSIFIITKYIFPSRDDVLFSRDTVRFESGSPPGLRLGCKKTKEEEDAQTRT